jgi:hypothetical protein
LKLEEYEPSMLQQEDTINLQNNHKIKSRARRSQARRQKADLLSTNTMDRSSQFAKLHDNELKVTDAFF